MNDLLQMQWDAALVASWMRNDWHTRNACEVFMGRHHLPLTSFLALQRVPIWQQWEMPTRAFVASGLPALSDRLWRGDQASDVVFWLEDSGLRTGMPKRGTFAALRKAERDIRRTRRVDMHAGHRRADWNVCKT